MPIYSLCVCVCGVCPYITVLASNIIGEGRSSEVERSLMVRWVVGSIRHGGPIELFLMKASYPRLV